MRATRIRVALTAMTLLVAAAAIGGEPDLLVQLPAHIAVDSRLHVSAQPTAEALVRLPAAGVRTVINLRPASETPDLDEKSLVENAGMAYRWLPIAGSAGLTRENVSAFDRMLAESGEGRVLVHCASGNRVGAMMALRARWVQAKSPEEALAIGKGAGLKGLEGDVKALLQPEAPKVEVPDSGVVSGASADRPQN